MKSPIKTKMQIVIPMSGLGDRFRRAGYQDPKPLIRISETPIIERLLEKIPEEWSTTFILSEDHQATALPDTLKKLRPHGQIFYVKPHKKGPGWALFQILDRLQNEVPILVSYCDFGLSWDPWDFKRFVEWTDCEACVICYRGFHAHYLSPTTYAYCRMANSRVVEIKEKGSFTEQRESEPASAGMYYFRSKSALCSALAYQFANSIFHNDEAYISLTTQSLLLMNPIAKVTVYEIPCFFQWGTPEDLEIYEYWEKNWQVLLQSNGDVNKTQATDVWTLIPMAGLGTRFQNLTPVPKPLIQIGSQRMFEMAVGSLPPTAGCSFVTTKKIAESLPQDLLEKCLQLSETPAGQALTTLAGIKGLKIKKSLLVSSCDHMVKMNDQLWKDLLRDQSVDAAIMTIRGFPGCLRTPNSFAYVNSKKGSSLFEDVTHISVKKSISEKPNKDQLLVGTFWFRDSQVLEKSIETLLQEGNSVNGEFYLDSVFDIYLKDKKRVVAFPLESYMNLGDPGSLAEYIYWREVFTSQKLNPRLKFGTIFGGNQ